MARRAALVKPRKKVTRSAPVVRRGKKLAGPEFTGWESWTGEQFYKFKHNAKYFYYENYQEADLQTEVWTWMKDNKFSVKDIKNAKAAKGWNSISVWAAISCKLLNTGCPDFNKIEADYWNNLPGTEGELQPMTDYIKKNIAKAIKSGSKETAEEKVEEDKQVKPVRANIQEIMRDRATEAFGGVETLADEFYISGYPKEFATRERVLAFLNEQKTLPQHVSRYVKYWESLKAEYEAAKLGEDIDIKEGYRHLTRTQINNLIRLLI